MQRDARLRQRIVDHLRHFAVQAGDAAAGQAAAVAVAITDEGHGAGLAGMRTSEHWSTRAALVLTRRAGGLRSHAGQWALPGGRIDAGETPERAALRELDEEVGLRLGADSVLGRLDDFATRSGYVITPVLVWAGAAHEMTPNPQEVRSIHRIPIDEFLRADAPMLEQRDDSTHPVLRMPVGDSWIAAPTAAVLYQFRELCILGRPTRVAHFEQPRFAWK
jgi:8-oxo-dGTP pyrophosphatase MutT (NUDIX family)